MAGETRRPGLGLWSGWTPGTDGWNAGMDENLTALSAWVGAAVIGITATLPASPAKGDAYLVSGGQRHNQVAVRDDGTWIYLSPKQGMLLYIRNEDKLRIFIDGGWHVTDARNNINLALYWSKAEITPWSKAEYQPLTHLGIGSTILGARINVGTESDGLGKKDPGEIVPGSAIMLAGFRFSNVAGSGSSDMRDALGHRQYGVYLSGSWRQGGFQLTSQGMIDIYTRVA